MWPYSAEENEWLRPLRLKRAALPSPEHGANHAAGALPAETEATVAGDLAAAPRHKHPKH